MESDFPLAFPSSSESDFGVRKTHTTTNRSVDIFVLIVNGEKQEREIEMISGLFFRFHT